MSEMTETVPRPDNAATSRGEELYAFMRRLFPICRSITGDGLRETLAIIGEHIPLSIHEVASGTKVFDWTIPREWNITDAYVKDARGRRVIDFGQSNLRVVNYSAPVHRKMALAELKHHLHALPEHPDWIPYRTSYYNESWGFCLTQRELDSLKEEEYEVMIASSLQDGALTYGECLIPGATDEEILLYTHTCHPSLCNDNLSGIAVATYLAKIIASRPNRYTYRLVFGPGTIGSITWLACNEAQLGRIRHGMVVALVGDAGPFSYKKSRSGAAEIDRMAIQVLRHWRTPHQILEFTPYGYDERQFCSPGINLPVGRLTRSPNGAYREYHTSADNLDFVHAGQLQDSLEVCLRILGGLEANRVYLNTHPKGEPQLGRRGLYRKTGGQQDVGLRELALLWVLNLSDGQHSLLDIAERADLPMQTIVEAAGDLEGCALLRPVQ
jgi:aminopeptidase-like protein